MIQLKSSWLNLSEVLLTLTEFVPAYLLSFSQICSHFRFVYMCDQPRWTPLTEMKCDTMEGKLPLWEVNFFSSGHGKQGVSSPFRSGCSWCESPNSHWPCLRTRSRFLGTWSRSRWDNPRWRLVREQCWRQASSTSLSLVLVTSSHCWVRQGTLEIRTYFLGAIHIKQKLKGKRKCFWMFVRYFFNLCRMFFDLSRFRFRLVWIHLKSSGIDLILLPVTIFQNWTSLADQVEPPHGLKFFNFIFYQKIYKYLGWSPLPFLVLISLRTINSGPTLRARLHWVSASIQRQHCDDASDSSLNEYNTIAPKGAAILFKVQLYKSERESERENSLWYLPLLNINRLCIHPKRRRFRVRFRSYIN